MQDILSPYIRDIVDFPKAGIVFKDITPLLKNPKAMQLTIEALVKPFLNSDITAVVGMEARGFIFGSLVAQALELPFVPLRKPNKLPAETKSISYDLEYGTASLDIHSDALNSSDKVLVIDDLLATGGTAKASCELVEMLGANVAALAFVIELDFLSGREQLKNYTIHSLLHY